MNQLRVALIGNPNSGKSSLFNALTGSHQHVGNWPGKTVEKISGKFSYDGYEIEVVDLPGMYSLSAFTQEEVIARDFIFDERPDVVVTVVDATNLERNMYLLVQVLELGVPVVVALTMTDSAETRKVHIDHSKLSQTLNIPIVPMVAPKMIGVEDLIRTVIDLSHTIKN